MTSARSDQQVLNLWIFLRANTFCTRLADPQCHYMACEPALCHNIALGGIANLAVLWTTKRAQRPLHLSQRASGRNDLLGQVTQRPPTAAGAYET
jgi:hypothetical protein